MKDDNTQPATAPAYLAKAQSDLVVFNQPLEQDGVFVFASIECAEVMEGRAYLSLDVRTGTIALALPCGCASTINISAMLLTLAAQQARKHSAAAQVH